MDAPQMSLMPRKTAHQWEAFAAEIYNQQLEAHMEHNACIIVELENWAWQNFKQHMPPAADFFVKGQLDTQEVRLFGVIFRRKEQ